MVVKSIETEDIDTEHGVPFQIFYVRTAHDFSPRCKPSCLLLPLPLAVASMAVVLLLLTLTRRWCG